MRFQTFTTAGGHGIALLTDNGVRGLISTDRAYPGDLDDLVRQGQDALERAAAALSEAPLLEGAEIGYPPLFTRAPKILCVGLNYSDHTAETHYSQPEHPTIFARFNTGLVGHNQAIVKPRVSEALDFEGELVAVIGRGGRYIPKDDALSHVIGYTVFNDGSIRDYQHRTPQWTLGKNFDGTGALGPVFVTADELPIGATGLAIETRLNGQVVQSSNTDNLIFDLPTIISAISEAVTLEAGDLIVTGTPAGVGHSREPKLYMKPGDVVEVEIEKIGILRNPIVAERDAA